MSEVELMAVGMEPGTSLRELCPRCGGGQGGEKSLALTVDESGWLLWNCFRASCGFKGRKLLWGVVQPQRGTPQKPPQTFSGALEPITSYREGVGKWLWDGFRLGLDTYNDLGWRYAPDCDRIYIPYCGPKGQFRGPLLRAWKNKPDGPKNLVYKEIRDEPFIGWFPQTGSGRPVLVEDAISACKVYQSGINSISLCGTNLSAHMVREILAMYPEVDIALDKDAFAKAVGYAGQYRGVLGMRVWKLEKDLKYVPEERIREAYFGEATDFSRDQGSQIV